MSKLEIVLTFAFGISLIVTSPTFAQDQVGPGKDPFPHGDNQWRLGYGVIQYSDVGSFKEVARQNHGDRDAHHPQESNGVYTDKDKIVLANPPTGCQNTGPAETNACTFTSTSATQQGDNEIRYSFRSWGGRCDIWLRVMAYPKTTKWVWADYTPWSNGSPFVVVVPSDAQDAEVFGKLNGKNIFFTPSDPLSAQDAVHFDLIGHPVAAPGLGTIYRFKTK